MSKRIGGEILIGLLVFSIAITALMEELQSLESEDTQLLEGRAEQEREPAYDRENEDTTGLCDCPNCVQARVDEERFNRENETAKVCHICGGNH